MFELKIITQLSAAHQLKMVGAKCENLHGHNWKIEVFVQGTDLNEAGVLVDFGDLKKEVAAIIKTLDHKFLNELPAFKNSQPSSEKIAYFIAQELKAALQYPNIRVSRVAAWESDDACATYYPESS